jgi:hypothetical protein
MEREVEVDLLAGRHWLNRVSNCMIRCAALRCKPNARVVSAVPPAAPEAEQRILAQCRQTRRRSQTQQRRWLYCEKRFSGRKPGCLAMSLWPASF